MAKRTIILRGLPGSGKSTAVKDIPDPLICSADDYWMVDGVYKFDFTKLHLAHRACLWKFCENIDTNRVLVVDNTNILASDIAPYYAVSEAYGRSTMIITVECDVATSIARNTHGVPPESIEKMAYNLYQHPLPSHWWHETLKKS